MYQILLKNLGYLLVMDTEDTVVTKIRKSVFDRLSVPFEYNTSLLRELSSYSDERIMNYSSYLLSDFELEDKSYSEMKFDEFIKKLLMCIDYESCPASYKQYDRYLFRLKNVLSVFGCKLNSSYIVPYSLKFMALIDNKENFLLGDIFSCDVSLHLTPKSRGIQWRDFIIDKDVYNLLNKVGYRCCKFSIEDYENHIYKHETIEKKKEIPTNTVRNKSSKQRLFDKLISGEIEISGTKASKNTVKPKKPSKVKQVSKDNIQDLLTREVGSLYDIITREPVIKGKNFYYKDGDIVSMEVDFGLITLLDEDVRSKKVLEYKDEFISLARHLLQSKISTLKDKKYKIDFKFYNCTRFIYRKGLSQVTVKFELRKDILKLKDELQDLAVQNYKDKHHIV